MIKNISGYCPETNSEKSITITYSRIPSLNTCSDCYKATQYDCENEDCSLRFCPIYLDNVTL